MNDITKNKSESLTIFEWFENKYLKANGGKSQVMWTTDDKLKINVASCAMKQQ